MKVEITLEEMLAVCAAATAYTICARAGITAFSGMPDSVGFALADFINRLRETAEAERATKQ